MCRRRESNPHGTNPQGVLSPLCLSMNPDYSSRQVIQDRGSQPLRNTEHGTYLDPQAFGQRFVPTAPRISDDLLLNIAEFAKHGESVLHRLQDLRRLDPLGGPNQPLNGREALREALIFEEAALEGYQDLLKKVEGDVPLEEFVRAQIALEYQHVAQLKELLAE